ncbi:MAG TPA: clostripain-related cysteine peptidase [Roseiflexaceae bacterium]|nr:clostripain-related cysteine peptidase [Roseiflexaceae bacterium]
MPPQIIGLRGEQANKAYTLGDAPFTFGRNPDNAVVFAGGRASRRHAEIRREGADYVLADLGSSNGTLVNGQRLTAPHRLRSGDTFEIGDDLFRFESPAPAIDKTLMATPAPIAAPPTVPAGQQSTQPPYQPPASPPGAYVGTLPTTPPAAAPNKRGASRTLLMILGLVALVLMATCVGGAVLITRSASGILSAPTSGAARTPQPDSGAVPTRVPQAGEADWTVLVYLDGDNNLERDALADLNEMERVGSNERINIVVQLDRIHQSGPEDDTSNGDWDSTKRFLVEQDDDRETIASRELDDLGEQNMGDPQTLVDFATWGVKQYPAQRYALILWDHGSSWAGIAFDDTDGEKGISMPELEVALRTTQAQAGIDRFDLIGFDACLMSQLDVLQAIAPYGRVGVASAELEPNDGWSWDVWLEQLNRDPAQDASAVGTSIVDSYQQYYQDGNDDTVTLAAFDLQKIEAVRDGLGSLSDAMLNDLGGSYQAIAEARSAAAAYSQPKPEEFSAVDLGDFTRLIERQGAQGQVAASAQALGKLIDDARIAEWHGSFHDRSTGMSIFFPQVAELYPDFYDKASPLPRDTSWANFLKAFHQAGGQQVSAPVIDDLRLSSPTVGFGNPATLQGTVTGKDIAYIFFFAGIPNADRTSVELTDLDYIYPPGSSPNSETPAWGDGANPLRQTWDGSRWALSNGTQTIPVLMGPTKYGTNLYGVEGIYTINGSGEQIAAGLLFEVNQGRAELRQIYGFPKSNKQETQPFEITPSAGDTFTALLRTYTIKDGRPVPDFNQGQTLTLGDGPLSALLAPADNGDYVAGFLVRDISGHFSYQYLDIAVDNSGATPATPPSQPQPAPGPGGQTGTLAYGNDEGKFALEYPAAWQTLDTGKSQIFFYDPAETSQTYLSVEYFATKQEPAQANQAVIDAYIEILGKESGFQHGDTQAIEIAGQPGSMFKYRYTHTDGQERTGTAIAVTSPSSGLSYAITVQALSSDFDGQADTFDQILNSLRFE